MEVALSKKDVFISHASEDKQKYVYPLVKALKKRKISYWLDEAEINWGERITRKINEGISKSRFVIVLLTSNFLRKNWPTAELESALHLENASGNNIVLPILVAPDKEIFKQYPLMRDKLYISWQIGPEAIASKLLVLLHQKNRSNKKAGMTIEPSKSEKSESINPRYHGNRWVVITSEGTEYSDQQIVASRQFSFKLFQDKLKAGYYLTNLSYASGHWTMAFSKGSSISAQTCLVCKYFPRETIKRRISKGFKITSLSYGLGKWIVVLSKGSEFSHQLFNIRSTFPDAWIRKNYNPGYRVTSLAYGGGKWAITLSKGSKLSSHKWWTPRTFPQKYIRDSLNESYQITSLVYGDGEWAIILSKGSNYFQQSWHFIDSIYEGEIKTNWPPNNYVTEIGCGPI